MNLDVNLLGAMIAASWALSLPIGAIGSVLIALLVFFSDAIPVGLLFLISLNLISFLQAIVGGRRSASGITQKRYFISFFGLFAALFGSALVGSPFALPLMFFGLLLSIANGISTFFFSSHFEKLSLNSFLVSVVIPSLVSLNLLLKVKPGMKADYAQLWDISLTALCLCTLFSSVVLALQKNRLKLILIYFCQAWMGILLFLLLVDSEELGSLTFAAISILIVSSSVLLNLGSQLGPRYFAAAKVFTLGLPGLVGFSALLFTLRMAYGLNLMWLVSIGCSCFLLSVAILRTNAGVVNSDQRVKVRFWVVMAVQSLSGVALFALDKGFLK